VSLTADLVIWALMVDPFKPLPVPFLLTLVFGTALLALLAQVLFPDWASFAFSPIHLAIAGVALMAFAMAFVMGFIKHQSGNGAFFWMSTALIIFLLIIFEALDVGIENFPSALELNDALPAGLISRVLALIAGLIFLYSLFQFLKKQNLTGLALFFFAIYVALNAFEDKASVTSHISYTQGLGLQFFMLLALEFFLLLGYRASLSKSSGGALLASTEAFGSFARELFAEGSILKSARHPPLRVAFFPVLKEATVVGAMVYLLVKAGRALRREKNISLFRQTVTMLQLWFRDGIDPPTYYSFELYRPERMKYVSELLTRFETKNGLFATLNHFLPNVNAAKEMNDKAQFSALCVAAKIPHPALIAEISDGQLKVLGNDDALKQDIFIKPRRGMGALGTSTFQFLGSDCYRHANGNVTDLAGVCSSLSAQSQHKILMAQPWLRNHKSIADIADQSLLAFRVITCLGRDGEPVVMLAMLRLLSKLEPHWLHLPDEEYASEINIDTGELGLFLGDNFATSHIHMTHHPVTGSKISGRIISEWPSIMKVARDVHAVCRHRVVVGWDIALTPQGPMVLEGNSNFDVMFLQRVIGKGIGQTPLAPLLRYHLEKIVAA
jgi:Sugar-transfer associated ATP-grasp